MTVPVVDVATLRGWLAEGRAPWLVHAGGPASFRLAHLPGAIRFPEPAVAVAVLRPDDLVVVYAEEADGRDAVAFARELRRRGLRRTFHLDGGLAAWRSAGGGVEGQTP